MRSSIRWSGMMSPRLLGCTFTLVYAGTLPVVSNRLSYTYICDLQHMEREGHSVGKRLTALISVGDACASPVWVGVASGWRRGSSTPAPSGTTTWRLTEVLVDTALSRRGRHSWTFDMSPRSDKVLPQSTVITG